ncbi:unnamed protein product [Blepharisma stoltei]|uniref:PNPLA domain-containing protein n=1 Tax=Blepharisma stoltei TaxID=1481888 RepID=A0AAU9J1G6_9CILI|nr:unnamed protein product [Blepharisma stoltei]
MFYVNPFLISYLWNLFMIIYKYSGIWSTGFPKNAIEEIFDLYEVAAEITGKMYSSLLSLIWDAGEIIVFRKKLEKAKTWKEWRNIAEKIDYIEGKEAWKKREQSPLYDYRLLRRRLMLIRSLREKNDIQALVHHLRSGLYRGLGGSLNPQLYQKCLVDTKYLVMEYQAEVCNSLKFILNSPQFPLKSKLTFFSDSRYAFGKTALLMSGGGGLGMYHLGVVKTLYEQDLLPKVIAGTSAGSLVAAFIGTTKWEQIPEWFKRDKIKYGPFSGLLKGSWKRKIARLWKDKHMMDIKTLEVFLRGNIGDLTFEEAYEMTGIVLNITVCEWNNHSDYRLLNYLTAPHVLVWSAALASCAIPYIFEAVELKCKDHKGNIVPFRSSGMKFIDGSIKADLPMLRLAELFNVNAFIVSQTNPWIIPLLTADDGGGSWGDSFNFKVYRLLKKLIVMEFRHRVKQISLVGLLDFLTSFLGIFTQEYRGHVTIWPVPSIKDYLNILSNPTDDDIQRSIRKSEIRTFPKINMLQSIMAIEKTFDSCYQQIRAKLRFKDLRFTVALHGQAEDFTIRESPLIPGTSLMPDSRYYFEHHLNLYEDIN